VHWAQINALLDRAGQGPVPTPAAGEAYMRRLEAETEPSRRHVEALQREAEEARRQMKEGKRRKPQQPLGHEGPLSSSPP